MRRTTAVQSLTTSRAQLGYWKIRGLAQSIRYILVVNNVPFEDVQYEATGDAQSGYSRAAWVAAKPTIGSPFTNLPYLVDPELPGQVLCESKAIMQHLGRKYNMYGADETERATIDMVVYAAEDVRASFTRLCYGHDFAAQRAPYIADLPRKLAALEAHTAARHAAALPHIASRALSIADLFVYEVIENLITFAPSAFATLPALTRFHATVHALPALVAYRASPTCPTAFNNIMAHWK